MDKKTHGPQSPHTKIKTAQLKPTPLLKHESFSIFTVLDFTLNLILIERASTKKQSPKESGTGIHTL